MVENFDELGWENLERQNLWQQAEHVKL